MAWTDIPDFTVGQVLTSSRMNEMRDNANIGHVVCTSATRPSSPDTGAMIYETDTGNSYIWDGSAWQQFVVSGGALTLTTLTLTNTPMWSGIATTATTGAVWANYQYVTVNVGSNFNATTGVFTAPESGYYFCIASAFQETTATPPSQFYLQINGTAGTSFRRAYTGASGYVPEGSAHAIFSMSANDTLNVIQANGAGHYNQNNIFSGWRIG